MTRRMALRPPLDGSTPSHRMYAGPSVDARTEFAAENAVVDALCESCSHVHLAAAGHALEDQAPAAGRAFRSLPPVSVADRLLYGDEERVGVLPDDREAVVRALGHPIGSVATDDWGDFLVARAFHVEGLVVRDGDRPRYHAVPHELHVRDVYAGDAPGVLDAVESALDGFDGVAVYSTDPLVSWTVCDAAYSVTPTTLRRERDGERTGYQLERLAAVERNGSTLVCEWLSMTETATDAAQRLVDRVYEFVADEPPETIPTDHEETARRVVDALVELRDALGYDLRIE